MALHEKGHYTVKDNHIIIKSNDKIIKKPAIVVDAEFICVHRFDDALNIKRDYATIVHSLRDVNPSFAEHLMEIEYDSDTNKLSFDFDTYNGIDLSVDNACSIINLIMSNTHLTDKVYELLHCDVDDIPMYAEKLYLEGF